VLYNINVKERDMLYNRYAILNDIYSTAKDQAYQKVFREFILAHITSGYRLSDDEISIVQKEFVSCVLIYIGSNILKDLEILYGNKDSIIINMVNDLNIRIENDEIYGIEKLQIKKENSIDQI
jgi:hypothetical protein